MKKFSNVNTLPAFFFGAALLLLSFARPASAQSERFDPYVPRPDQTQARVWSEGAESHARVTFTFPMGGFQITDWGAVERQGNNFSVDVKVERWTGIVTQAIVVVDHFYDLGQLAPGTNYTFTVRSRGSTLRTVSFDPAQVAARWEEVSLARDRVSHAVFTVGGVTFGRIQFFFPETGYRVASWGQLTRSGNDFSVTARVERFTGPSQSRVFTDQRTFVLGENLPPDETFTLTVRFPDGTAWQSHPWTPAGQRVNVSNWSDNAYYFVRQHYLDFFGREADAAGLTFWAAQIMETCGGLPECLARKRINPSGAFFLSTEFRGTGFFVHRLYRAAYGRTPTFAEALPDARAAGAGVIDGEEGWEGKLEANKRRVTEAFVARPEFLARYPETMTPEQFVDALNANTSAAGNSKALSSAERDQLANDLRGGVETRAGVLRRLVEDADFQTAERNLAFVVMQYMGYLRRDPDAAGLAFWLKKLNDHNGDFHAAEMVKSFLDSGEYRQRFASN